MGNIISHLDDEYEYYQHLCLIYDWETKGMFDPEWLEDLVILKRFRDADDRDGSE